MTVDYAADLKVAKLVKIAGIEGSYGQAQFDALNELGYTFLEEIWGDALGEHGSFGYVALEKTPSDASVLEGAGEVVVCFRGTDPKRVLELFADALAVPVSNPYGKGLVHFGFLEVYKSLQIKKAEPSAVTVTPLDYVKSLYESGQANRMLVAGHSLGGAVATLLAESVTFGSKENRYRTFGCPRVFDYMGADTYDVGFSNETLRYENWIDPIPNLPMNPPFKQTQTKERLKGKPKLDPLGEHVLTEYISLLEEKVVG